MLPFDFDDLRDTVATYVEEVMKLADSERAEIEERDRRLRDHTFEIAADPTKPFFPPKAEDRRHISSSRRCRTP